MGDSRRAAATGTAGFERLKRYFARELWQVDLAAQPKWRRVLLRQAQLWVLVAREFAANRCMLRAAALAFTTLLSIVPLLALMFAILKSFGVQNRLEPLLLEHLAAGSESVATAIISYIDNTSVGQLGVIGLVFLILSVLSLISGIERSFNDIWGVEETRSIPQRFTNYFSVLTIGPVFVVAAITMTGSLESRTVVQWLLDMALVGNLLLVLLGILPFVVMWLVFAGLYLFIPNTRVLPRAAVAGGIFSGTLWQLSQWAYVDFQVGVAKYNAIYGALAALPIFMVWLSLAWAIVLLGLEVTYAVQNLQSERQDLRGGRIGIGGRTRAVLAILLHVGRRFRRGEPAPTAEAIAAHLAIPPRLTRGLLDLLLRQGVIVAAGVDGYHPAREPDTVRLDELLAAVAADGADYLPPPGCPEEGAVTAVVERLAAGAAAGMDGMTLRDLIEQTEVEPVGGAQADAGT